MFAAVLEFLFFLFVTFFLVPVLVVLAHAMRSWALSVSRRGGRGVDQQAEYHRPVDSSRDRPTH